jgi:hypothetical protein
MGGDAADVFCPDVVVDERLRGLAVSKENALNEVACGHLALAALGVQGKA